MRIILYIILLLSICVSCFFYRYGDHRDLHVLTHSFPTRRSSDLIVCQEPAGTRTLATLRDRLTLAPQAFAAQLEAMQAQGGLTARAANRHLGKSDREAAGVLSAAQRHTHFLDSPRMTAVLGHSDFTFADVKAQPTSVYLVLPPDRLATSAPWLRLTPPQPIGQEP